ncbi:MAG: DUF1684 domain-containing protein [Woeseiaceae bacterium]|nr:DUF1684 domain-containing protein [Woeseiaceae bacterium]
MKKRLTVWLSVPLLAAVLAACGPSGATLENAAHTEEVLEWRSWRIAQLKDSMGYLNQIGLYWLEPGTYSFGSATTNDLIFGGSEATKIGEFTVTTDGVSMAVLPGIEVKSDDVSVRSTRIAADTTERANIITHGTLAWTVIEEEGRYAVRLRDFEHPFVASFGPLPYFAIDPSLLVDANLRRYPEPKIANVGTVIEGLGYHPESPGVVEFQIDGQQYELEAYVSGDRLFYVFGDQTNRDDTYGAGRFLYSTPPNEDGSTVLDFNKAYSPPCAFNDFTTCPVASPQNRLPIRVEAGEKFDQSLHYAAGY